MSANIKYTVVILLVVVTGLEVKKHFSKKSIREISSSPALPQIPLPQVGKELPPPMDPHVVKANSFPGRNIAGPDQNLGMHFPTAPGFEIPQGVMGTAPPSMDAGMKNLPAPKQWASAKAISLSKDLPDVRNLPARKNAFQP